MPDHGTGRPPRRSLQACPGNFQSRTLGETMKRFLVLPIASQTNFWASGLALGILLFWTTGTHAADTRNGEVRVLSYNIRMGTAKDGENHWDCRKAALIATIKTLDPDLLGTQETLGFQRDYLAANLPQYDHLGVGREDGRERGEMMALYYKKDRFEKLDGGHFWLSETPNVAGSKSWDSSLPRMVTWVKLSDRCNPGTPPIVFFNTHFDHLGVQARLQSARLLRRQVLTLGQGGLVIVTGDFNSGEGSEPYQALFGPVDAHDSPLIDTFRVACPNRTAQEGTFSGFKADATGGARIDWIGVSRNWQVLHAGIDRTATDGRTPSDHFAVFAVLRPEVLSTQ